MPLSRKALGPGRLVNALGSRGVTGWAACLKKRVTSAVCGRGQLGQSKMCPSPQIACKTPGPCLVDRLLRCNAVEVSLTQWQVRSKACRIGSIQLAGEMLLVPDNHAHFGQLMANAQNAAASVALHQQTTRRTPCTCPALMSLCKHMYAQLLAHLMAHIPQGASYACGVLAGVLPLCLLHTYART